MFLSKSVVIIPSHCLQNTYFPATNLTRGGAFSCSNDWRPPTIILDTVEFIRRPPLSVALLLPHSNTFWAVGVKVEKCCNYQIATERADRLTARTTNRAEMLLMMILVLKNVKMYFADTFFLKFLPPPRRFVFTCVCLLVGLFVCVFVTRITQKLLSGFPWKLVEGWAKEEPIKFWCGSG